MRSSGSSWPWLVRRTRSRSRVSLIGQQLLAVEMETGVELELVVARTERDRRGEFAGKHEALGDGLIGRVGNR